MAATNSDSSMTTPTRVVSMDSEITGAPRRSHPEGFKAKYVIHAAGSLRYEWPLPGGRIGGYIFDDEERCVTLYTLYTPGMGFTNDMPHISYSAEGWKMSRSKIWKDLGVWKVDSGSVFKNSDALFKWFLLEDRLEGVKVKLF